MGRGKSEVGAITRADAKMLCESLLVSPTAYACGLLKTRWGVATSKGLENSWGGGAPRGQSLSEGGTGNPISGQFGAAAGKGSILRH
jgi:hypothetical protein